MRTILWQEVGETLLIVHAKVEPDPSDWAALMQVFPKMGRRMQRVLVFADVALNAEQRRQVTAGQKAAGTRAIAVITSSRLGRLAVTALSWMTGVHKAFDPSEVRAALDYLGVTEDDRRVLLASALQFARELHHTRLEATLSAA